ECSSSDPPRRSSSSRMSKSRRLIVAREVATSAGGESKATFTFSSESASPRIASRYASTRAIMRAVFPSDGRARSVGRLARVNRPGDHLAFPRGLPDRAIALDGTGEQRVTGRRCERECATASRRGIFFSRNRTDPWSGRMPNYLSPGVYVEEVSSGSKPIEGVGTAVAAFVGFAERGPVNTPTLVTNWTQYTQNFGEFIEGSYL